MFLVVFALNDPESLENAQNVWKTEIREHSEASMILVGNKSELRDHRDEDAEDTGEEERISKEAGEAAASTMGAHCYMETSCLLNVGVAEVFQEVLALGTKDRKVLEKKTSSKACVIL